jgi:RND family efflux transporter MFP subunit
MLGGCGGEPEAQRPEAAPPLPATLATVEQSSWPDLREVTATVQPLRRATPGTVLMGTVDEILRREGERVKAGDLLARVESREVAARLAQAEAGVAAARAQEGNARVMKERLERLHAKQAATTRSLDDARAAWEAASAQLRAAEEGVKAARVALDHSNVTAPFDGIVTERRVEVGDIAAPGLPLFVVDDLSRVKVEAQVAESDIAGLRPGAAVAVEIPAAGGGEREAALAEILPAADPRSRSFTVRALLDNPDLGLLPGMFARLRLPRGERPVVSAPESALVLRGALTGVFVMDGEGVARLRWVTVGRIRGESVEILSGLAGGERVVAPVPPGLQDGRHVEAR